MFYFAEDVALQQEFVNWANPSREYVVGVFEVLRGWGERLATKEYADLQAELLVKNRSDNRVATALKWLEVLGITSGSFESHDLCVARELDLAQLPASVGSDDKRLGDLQALLHMVYFSSRAERCRRQQTAEHFGLEVPQAPCSACDVCTDANTWRSQFLPARAAHAAPQASTGLFARGQWVRVDGRHLGRIVRVEGEGRRTRLFVESADNLEVRSVDPRRARVVEGGIS